MDLSLSRPSGDAQPRAELDRCPATWQRPVTLIVGLSSGYIDDSSSAVIDLQSIHFGGVAWLSEFGRNF
jgi:hypothetical protein